MTYDETYRASRAMVTYVLGALGLSEWEAEVRIEEVGGGRASIKMLDQHEHAVFRFDPEAGTDLRTLASTVRHECCHVLHSPLEIFYEVWFGMTEGGDSDTEDSPDATADRVWRHGIERFVLRLERVLERTPALCLDAIEAVGLEALRGER